MGCGEDGFDATRLYQGLAASERGHRVIWARLPWRLSCNFVNCTFRDALPCGDALDFYVRALGEGLDGDGATCREGGGEELRVNFVHCGKISHIGQEDCGLDNVGEVQAGLVENCFGVSEALAGLLLDSAFGESARRGIYRKLSRNEYQTVSAVYCL